MGKTVHLAYATEKLIPGEAKFDYERVKNALKEAW